MTPLSKRQWLCALTIAALIHGTVALSILRAPPEAGSVAAGAGGITMALGPAGRVPGSVQTLPPPTANELPEQPDDVDEVAAADIDEQVMERTAAELDPKALEDEVEERSWEVSDIQPVDEADLAPPPTEAVITQVPVEDQPTDPAETVEPQEAMTVAPAEAINPLPPDTSVRVVEPEEVVAKESREAEPAQPVAPETADEPEPMPVQPEIVEAAEVLPEETVASAPEPAQETTSILPPPRKPPSPVEEKTKPPREDMVDQPDQQAGAGGEAGDQAEGDLGSGQNTSGGGAPGGRADYFAVLQAWLEQHKVYPRRALSRRLEGVVSIRFVMNRDGKVLDYRIEESSGHRLLDHAVQTLIERAQPLPTMPDEMSGANITLVVPISFVLN